jgi:hypothetical protein
MMDWLRYFLIGASAVMASVMFYVALSERDAKVALVFAIALLANLIYLWLNEPTEASDRLSHLFRLWVRAKEAELKVRLERAEKLQKEETAGRVAPRPAEKH